MAVWQRLRQVLRLEKAFKGQWRGAKTESVGPTRTQEELSKYVKEATEKHWQGYGIAPHDRKVDRMEFHFAAFTLAAMSFIPFWVFYYKRDFQMKHWAHREAALVMLEREKAGLPYVDRNFIDPAKLDLPSDEELDGAEVII